MMSPVQAAKKYLDEGMVMQLGTSVDDRSRVNSVFYVPSDDHRSVYWMSEPRRRHSHDLKKNSYVSGAIVVRGDWPVVGLQFTGVAHEVHEMDEITNVVARYSAKYGSLAEGFAKRYEEGKNKHLLYKLTLTTLEIFDQENFANDPVDVPLR